MPITTRFFVQSTTALLLVGFLALLGIVGTTFWLAERAQVYFNDVIEARDARGAAVELRNAVQTAESSQRGFLFTGNEIYLAPYDTAKTLAQRQLNALGQMLASYKDARASLQRLTAIITEKIREMDQTIALKRDRRDAEALAIVRTNRGKALMDEANVFFSGIISATDDRLTTGVGEQKANAAWLRWFSIIGGMIIVAVIGGATVTVLRYTRELGAARDEVSILNTGLEERVRSRTAELAKANAEIQRFAHIVTHDLRAPLVNIMGFTSELETSMNAVRALVDQAEAGGGPRRYGCERGPRCGEPGSAGGHRLHPLLDLEDGQSDQCDIEAVAGGATPAAAGARGFAQSDRGKRGGDPAPAFAGRWGDQPRAGSATHLQ